MLRASLRPQLAPWVGLTAFTTHYKEETHRLITHQNGVISPRYFRREQHRSTAYPRCTREKQRSTTPRQFRQGPAAKASGPWSMIPPATEDKHHYVVLRQSWHLHELYTAQLTTHSLPTHKADFINVWRVAVATYITAFLLQLTVVRHMRLHIYMLVLKLLFHNNLTVPP